MALNANAVNLAVAQANDIQVDEYFDKRLLEMIKLETSQFVFSNLGRKVEIPRKEGTKTIRLRRYNSLPVDLTEDGQGLALTEGTAPTPLKISAVKVDGTINQYGAYIEESDVANDIHMDDIKSIYQPELARHAAEVLERVVVAALADGSDYFVGDNSGTAVADIDEYTGATANAILTFDEVRKAWLSMKVNRRAGHQRFGGKPVLVVHPSVMQDLLDDQDLVDKLLVPGNENTPIKNGTLQQYMVHGMYFVESLILDPVASAGNGTPNVYTSYLLGNDPYVIIGLSGGGVKFLMTGFTADSGDPLAQKQTFGYKMWGGAKVIDPIAITAIHSLSGFDTVADFSDDPFGANAPVAQDPDDDYAIDTP
jgi:N4-gp56 family major capsid protein